MFVDRAALARGHSLGALAARYDLSARGTDYGDFRGPREPQGLRPAGNPLRGAGPPSF